MADAVGKRWLRGVILYTGTEVIPFAANLHALPLSHLGPQINDPNAFEARGGIGGLMPYFRC